MNSHKKNDTIIAVSTTTPTAILTFVSFSPCVTSVLLVD
jgi:hypothetical protein